MSTRLVSMTFKLRSSTNCYLILTAITCKNNMRYSDAVSGCPATCVDPNAQNKCKDEPSEGCECLPGFLLSDRKCVPQKECGCIRNGNYYPVSLKNVLSLVSIHICLQDLFSVLISLIFRNFTF